MRITIPQNSLVVLCGPAGCGKSTFAATHFLPTQIVSSDDCRAVLSDDPANQAVTPLAFELLHFIVEKRLLLRRLTVADATNLKREDRRPLLNIARQTGVNAVAIVFNASLDDCMSRNAGRARAIPVDALKAQHALLAPTLGSIRREGFNYVFVVGEDQRDPLAVRIGPMVKRRRKSSRRSPRE